MRSRVGAIALKELRLFFKDIGAVALTFLMPFMFILVMSLALGRLFGNEEGQPISILVVNEDGGMVGARVVRALRQVTSFRVQTTWQGQRVTPATARSLVSHGQVGVALVLPRDFTKRVELPPNEGREGGAVVELVVDPALSLYFVDPIHASVTGLVRQTVFAALVPQMVHWFQERGGRASNLAVAAQKAVARSVADDLVEGVKVERVYASDAARQIFPDTYQQNVPGYTIFGVFWIVALLSGSIIRERQEGTFRRLHAAPISRWVVLTGKLLPYLFINLLQVGLMLGASHVVFGLDLGGSVVGLAVVSLATAATATSLGVLVATVARTDVQAGSLSTLLLLSLSALGGCFVPRFIMPEWLRTFGWITPHAWALEAYQDLLVRGWDLTAVLPEVGALFLFAVFFFGLGVLRFRLD